MDDWQLLNEYATRQSEAALRALVDRYSPMVYHAALRQLRNPHAAEEITQAVFIALAQKAGKISRHTLLYGWLFRATRYAVLNYMRGENTRHRHEQEAIDMEALNAPENTESIWGQISPHLNDALERLPQADRDVLMIRFFGNKSHQEVARALGISEDTAKKRVSRAIERLRLIFSRRGIAVTSIALVAAFSAFGAQAAPAGLAGSVTVAATTKGTAASTLTTAKGILKLMAWTKAKTAIVAGVVAILAVGGTTVAIKHVAHHRELAVWDNFVPGTDNATRNAQDWEQLQKAPPAISIRPTKFGPQTANAEGGSGKVLGLHQPFDGLLARAYDISPCRIVALTPLPQGDFDFIVSGQNPPKDALKKEVEGKFGITGRIEKREVDVLELRVARRNAPGLKTAASPNGPSFSTWETGRIKRTSGISRYLAGDLEQYLQVPIVDHTGLTGHYDYDLRWDDEIAWDESGHWHYTDADSLKQVVLDQLGIELVTSREPVEMLVVEHNSR